MIEIICNKAKTYTVPASATQLSIQHEWGDLKLALTSVFSSYSFTPDSIGVHIFRWFDNTTTLIQTDYYSSIVNYVSISEFTNDFADLDDSEAFIKYEKKVRKIIESFTQQQFGPYISLTRTIFGQGNNALDLGVKTNSYVSVIDFFGNDISDLVLLDNSGFYIIRRPLSFGNQNSYTNGMLIDHDVKLDISLDSRSTFRRDLEYFVQGSFGYNWVPGDVVEATKLLIADEFDTDYITSRNHRITSEKLGDFSYQIATSTKDPLGEMDASTGNAQADALLSGYMPINIGLV